MNLINNRKRQASIIVILFIFILNAIILNQVINQNLNYSQNYSLNSQKGEINEKPETSSQQSFTNVSWLKNGEFSSATIDPWLNTTQGDSNDIIAGNSSGQADILVIGDNGTKEISNVFIDPYKWTPFNKTDVDTNPDNSDIDPNGAWCNHYYDEDANQFPTVYWRYNVSMDRDMSDYEITSASIEGTWNASVDANFDVEGDEWAHGGVGGDDIESRDLFDSIIFTIEVSDMNISPLNTYLVAENKTTNLGDDEPVITSFLNVTTSFNFKSEEDLKFYLTRVLENDPGHDNFTIILGISIICADNSDQGDIDEVYESRIKSLNLTFSYRKKIDKSTTLSWYQEGNMVNYTSVQVINAEANFEYKIDKDWNKTTFSQFSEFRILVNNKMQLKFPNVKLIDYNNSKFQGNFIEARTGGYDLTSLIPIKENITLSIQVYIGDNFELNQNINISIDNVYLNISYIVFFPEGTGVIIESEDDNGKGGTIEEPWIFLIIAIAAIVGAIILGAYFLEYYFVLKYPKPVRKVRKYRKTLKKKKSPNVDITSREKAFKSLYKKHSSSDLSKVKTSKEITNKIAKKSLKTSSNKITEKSAEQQGGDN